MNKKKNLLQVEHLSKSFGEQEVLKDLSFELEEGLSVSIEGPSIRAKALFSTYLARWICPTAEPCFLKGKTWLFIVGFERSVFRNNT